MTSSDFYEMIAQSPVIAAVKDEAGLHRALASDVQVVFVLFGTVCSVSSLVSSIKDAGRVAMVHVDLVAGLSNSQEVAVDFIREHTAADGIISTRQPFIRRARERGLLSIQRFFVLDSLSLDNIRRPRDRCAEPDLIEILPGLMPKIIRRVVRDAAQPVIAGGLITDKEDVMAALSAGALAVSSTNESVWFL